MNSIKNFILEEDGVTAIEYGLIAALIAGVIVAAMSTLGSGIEGVFKTISDKLTGVVIK